jgi:hypothetical protein
MGWRDRLPFGRRTTEAGLEPGSPSADKEILSSSGAGVIESENEFVHQTIQPGELSLEESANGGMGRHLGLFSTTFLM